MEKYIRIMLITDSLGCPRKEIEIEHTWVECIMKEFINDRVMFYTYCQPGLQVRKLDFGYFEEYKPDILICQFGIVDAVRRALTDFENKVVRYLQFDQNLIRSYLRKNHYNMTKKREIHYTKLELFDSNISQLIQRMGSNTYFIEIAPAGPEMVKKVYNIENDINAYNNCMKKYSNQSVHFLTPYEGQINFLLDDGHHLNSFGNKLVYQSVKTAITNELQTLTI